MAYRREGERLRIENDELRRERDEAVRALERLEGSARVPHAAPVLAGLLGGSADATVEASTTGRVDDEALAAALDYLTRRFDTSGEVVRVGKRFAWSTPHTFEQPDDVSVVIEERDGAVNVRARMRPARFGVVAYALFVGLVLPTAFAALAAWSHAPSLALVLPLLVLSVLASRWLFAAWARRRERAMHDVVRALSAQFAARSRTGLRVDADARENADLVQDEGDLEAQAEFAGAQTEAELARAPAGQRR